MEFGSSKYDDSSMTLGSGLESPAQNEKTIDALSVLQIIFCTLGIAGNIIIIFVILVLKEFKKTVTNWYVLQLSIADLMFLCSVPIKIKEKYDEKWSWGATLCKFNESIIFINYNTSIFFLTVMSIDRYLVVCHNSSAITQKLRKISSAYIATIIVWVVSLLLCTPIFMYSDVKNCKCRYEFVRYESPEAECEAMGLGNVMETCISMLNKSGICDDDGLLYNHLNGQQPAATNTSISPYEQNITEDDFDIYGDNNGLDALFPGGSLPDYSGYESGSAMEIGPSQNTTGGASICSHESSSKAWHAFVKINFFVLFVIPFIVMLTCYFFIVKMMVASSSRKTRMSMTSGERPKRESRKLSKTDKTYRRATKLCVAYVTMFAVCWLPFHSLNMAKLSGIQQSEEFCSTITSVFSLLVVVNSIINPCLYNIVGKKFSKRLRDAVRSVTGTIASQVDAMTSTSGLQVRYRKRKTYKSGSNSSSMTGTTKISIGKSEVVSGDQSSG